MAQDTGKSIPLGFTAITAAVIIWGSTFIVKPAVFAYVDPVQVIFLQALTGSAMFGGMVLFEKGSFRVTRKDMLFIVFSGMIGITLYQILLNVAIGMVGGVISSIFGALIPAMCLLSDAWVFKKKPNKLGICSIIAAFTGVLLIIGADGMGGYNPFGLILLVISNAVWIYYCYFSGRKPATIRGSVFLFYQMAGCTLMLFPYIATHPLNMSALALWEVQWRLAHLMLLPGALAYLLFFYAVNSLGVVVTNIANNLIPIVTLICNFAFFGEMITPAQVVGTCIVVAAVTLSSRAVD